ncbi:MAG TPA: protease, partial [Thermoanaerobaculia bacterium]|nr:protease [Thermoanaerobaculia bacterium]
MKRILAMVAVILASSSLVTFARSAPLLLQSPTMSETQIVFTYADDLWTVDRAGGEAHQLASGLGRESSPVFSPDGKWVAFSADVNDNVDVYVIPAEGGQATRLTYHPGQDVAVGWTPDGNNVLLRSHRDSPNDPDQLFTIPRAGGMPVALPLPMAEAGSFSPDGSEIAYSPVFQWEPDWKKYRGGQTTPIWIAKLSDSSVTKIPRDNSNDRDPMWVGNKVYFVSDREGAATLFGFDTQTGRVSKLLPNDGFDIDSASAGPGGIVYSQMGAIHVFDLGNGTEHQVPIEIHADLPYLRPHFENVADQIEDAGISPTGARAVFEAHGDILTVPRKKGDARNLTQSPGVADRSPAWSPDGQSIAYFSDRSGEYALYIEAQNGLTQGREIRLGQRPSFFYSPAWSPDGKKILYSDKRLNLWYVSLDHPTPVKVDTDLYDTPLHEFDAVWSPDSDWIAYTKQLRNHQRAVFVYSITSGKSTQVTDGLSDCLYPVFDKSGKYLFFTASTDLGLSAGWLD